MICMSEAGLELRLPQEACGEPRFYLHRCASVNDVKYDTEPFDGRPGTVMIWSWIFGMCVCSEIGLHLSICLRQMSLSNVTSSRRSVEQARQEL